MLYWPLSFLRSLFICTNEAASFVILISELDYYCTSMIYSSDTNPSTFFCLYGMAVSALEKKRKRPPPLKIHEIKVSENIPYKFKDLKFKHEIFVRIDMKHSYFSNYFITCLQSIFFLL